MVTCSNNDDDGIRPGIEFFEKIVGIGGRIDIADTYGQYFSIST
jgi:hypothetical protein